MSRNPVPLDKQLLHLDLSKGVDERTRPECGDPVTLITRLENLQTDQAGGWVKRPGLTAIGGTTDDQGNAIRFTRLLGSPRGLLAIGSTNQLYSFQENRSQFRKVGVMPGFTVDRTDLVGSSAGGGIPAVVSAATCTKYHASISYSNRGSLTLSIYEKESGTLAGTYALNDPAIQAVSARIMFVGDRYLHIGYTAPATGLCGVVVDTDAVLPRDEVELVTSITVLHADATASAGVIVDYTPHTDRSIWLYRDDPGAVWRLASMSNAQAALENVATTTTVSIANSGNKLWRIDATNLQAVTPTALGTVLVAAAAHGLAATGPIAATPLNSVYCAVQTVGKVFGATTIYSQTVHMNSGYNSTTMSAAHVTLDGWARASAPFVDGESVFMHVVKRADENDTIAPHVIANVSYQEKTEVLDFASGEHYQSGRIACSLEPHIGYGVAPDIGYWVRYFSHDSGVTFCPVVPTISSSRTFGYCFFTLKDAFHSKIEAAQAGGITHLSGGAPSTFGGERLYESGFVEQPIVNTAVGAAGGPTGALKYIAVYKRVDESGAVTWSRCSPISSITVANTKITVTITPPNLTNSDQSLNYDGAQAEPYAVAGVELYRTAAGGTQYYLCASSFRLAIAYTGLSTEAITTNASGYYVVTDELADATLITQPLMHRQPGTPNSPIDRYPPPPSNIVCQHKDRLFTPDAHGTRVYYSSFFVDGEAPWYNPNFSFLVHGGTGKFTGIVSMDGRLFIFKKDGIWVVDGDGPSEAGVTGNEFSPPMKLATEYGSIDHRSICVTPEGIVYRSKRGIEILTRSLQVKWIGDRVQNTVNSNPYTCWSVLDNEGRVHIGVAASEPTAVTVAGLTGAELVYDMPSNAWSIFFSTGTTGTYGEATQDACMVDLSSVGEVMMVADPSAGVRYKNSASRKDGSSYIPSVVETGWVRPGQQSRQRFSRALLLAKRQDYHMFTISAAYDYMDSYVQTFEYGPEVIEDGLIEELELPLNKPQSLAVRILIEENQADNQTDYPFTTGIGADILGITFEIAQKDGPPTLPQAKRGYRAILSYITDAGDDYITDGGDTYIVGT